MTRQMTSSRCATVVLLLFRCLRGVAMATAPLHLSRRLLGEGRRCAPPPPPVFTESQPLEPLFPVTDRHHFSGAIVPDHLSFTSIPGVQLPSLSSTVRTPSSSQSAPEPPPPRPRPRALLRRDSESRSTTVLEPLEVLPSQSRRNTVLLPRLSESLTNAVEAVAGRHRW
jgi:hypothetical protein